MEIEKIKSILDAIKDTDIEEIWFEKGGEKSGFRRKDISSSASEPSGEIVFEAPKPHNKESIQKVLSSSNQIKSTMVGTFLRSATPGGKPLVEEGDFVTVGQKVGIVEAMKVMKEITSQISGKMIKVLVADNHPVEYGQPLFEVDTDYANKKH
ncbi:MAG: acetyl-CoA carboxylase, biotin carboxyl carrier protein [Elusimicrobia bacterium HGW-Elusimicrobia-4]|nr:MAG: acetyl-CoA carboxylase, biotin carboxyl carrier protein [Elusimicrobia bacterium HGW-Elusimicrobia-4]